MADRAELTAPCGLDCFNCEIYKDNLTDELAHLIHGKLGVATEEIACEGCLHQDGEHYHLPPEGCATLSCAKEKGVRFCCDCREFPCALLAPLADGAARYPHNMKLYNLCRIKSIGLEAWLDEAGEIRRRYFKKAFRVGLGQSD